MEGEIKMNGWIARWREREISKSPPFPTVEQRLALIGILLLLLISISLSNQKFSLKKIFISSLLLFCELHTTVLFCTVRLIMEMRQLPMGCYFSPKPYECINFLSLKVHGSEDSSCSWGGLIFDCDPYNPKQLPYIFSTAETRDNLYFFAKLRRKGKIGSVHIDRTIVGVGENKGTWHADQTKEVRDADDVSVIGSARTFTYWGKKGDANNRRFLMTEYQLLPSNGNDSAALHYDPLKDHVLCHLRCAPEGKGKGKKAIKSINNLKMFDCALPLQYLPPQPPCPAANSDFTAEAFPSCFTTPTAEFASPAYSFQTPTNSPIDPALASFLADTDLITKDWDDLSDAQLDDADLPMDWVDLDLLMATNGNGEDVLPLSSAPPLHFHTDDTLALISDAAAVNPNFPLVPEFPNSFSTSANDASSYRDDVEPPTSLLPLANAAAIPSPALRPNPVAPVEDDYNIIFDTLPPINFQSHLNDLNWDDMSVFLDCEEPITCYNHPVFHDLN